MEEEEKKKAALPVKQAPQALKRIWRLAMEEEETKKAAASQHRARADSGRADDATLGADAQEERTKKSPTRERSRSRPREPLSARPGVFGGRVWSSKGGGGSKDYTLLSECDCESSEAEELN